MEIVAKKVLVRRDGVVELHPPTPEGKIIYLYPEDILIETVQGPEEGVHSYKDLLGTIL